MFPMPISAQRRWRLLPIGGLCPAPRAGTIRAARGRGPWLRGRGGGGLAREGGGGWSAGTAAPGAGWDGARRQKKPPECARKLENSCLLKGINSTDIPLSFLNEKRVCRLDSGSSPAAMQL